MPVGRKVKVGVVEFEALEFDDSQVSNERDRKGALELLLGEMEILDGRDRALM